jgi:ankyrin repeat protein
MMGILQDFTNAIKQGDINTIQQMLVHDPTLVNMRSAEGISAVLVATYYDKPDIASLFIERGAQLDIFDAAATGSLNQVQAIIETHPTLVNAYAADGFQPLGLASFFGQIAVAAYLIEHGAGVRSPSHNSMLVHPLHSAVAGQHLEIAKLLLDHGADANAVQADGFTPLHGAAENGDDDMVTLLLAYGANKTAQDSQGRTPLDLAVAQGYEDTVALLR